MPAKLVPIQMKAANVANIAHLGGPDWNPRVRVRVRVMRARACVRACAAVRTHAPACNGQ